MRLLRAIQAELATHEAVREERYRRVDPDCWPAACRAQAIGGPALVATMGEAKRFRARPTSAPSRARPQGIGDRQHRSQGPAHVQGRELALADHAGPGRRLGQEAGPPAGPDLLRPDDRAGQEPSGCQLRRGRPPGRAGLAGHAPGHALRPLRHRRHRRSTPGGPRPIIAERCTVTEETRKRRRSNKGGKAPQKVLTGHLRSHAKGVDKTRRPSPTPTPARSGASVKQSA